MARQAEYYHDPNAPRANSLRPTAFAVVREPAGRLLLARRSDTLNWELPGGKVAIGESAVDAVLREVLEETGVQIIVTGLSGVYTDPGHVVVCTSGEVGQQFALCFDAVPVSGKPRPDYDEITDVAWFSPDELDQVPIHPSMRLWIENALRHPDQVHIV